jgi:mannosyltransferase OCH1-like enzyme
MRIQLILFILVIVFLIFFYKRSEFKDIEDDTIPKIIHQVAMSKLRDEKDWPESWKHCQQSWRTLFPDYEYMLWDDDAADQLIRNDYPWFYNTYKSYKRDIFRIDAIRCFILHKYGGIYADMDYECLKNFEHLLPKGLVCITEGSFTTEPLQNSLMASPPNHEFWRHIWKYLEERKDETDVLEVAGPKLFIYAAEQHPELVYPLERGIFTKEYTMLYNPIIKIDDEIDENLVAIHHNNGSWVNFDDFLQMI